MACLPRFLGVTLRILYFWHNYRLFQTFYLLLQKSYLNSYASPAVNITCDTLRLLLLPYWYLCLYAVCSHALEISFNSSKKEKAKKKKKILLLHHVCQHQFPSCSGHFPTLFTDLLSIIFYSIFICTSQLKSVQNFGWLGIYITIYSASSVDIILLFSLQEELEELDKTENVSTICDE